MLRGVDVSYWQQTTPSLAGLAFLIARASIGTTPDPMYAKHISAARAAGLVTGAYHFNWDEDAAPSTPDATPEEQARFFVQTAGPVDFLFLDVEGTRAFEPAESDRFIAEVHRLGRKCGLYMSAGVYQWNVGQDYDWIAKWGSISPRGVWEFWQYRGSPLDLDYFNGTRDDLARLAGADTVILRANTPTPEITRGDVAQGTQFFTLNGQPLVKMSGPAVLTSVGRSGIHDIVIVTTGGVTQYALVLSHSLLNVRSTPSVSAETLAALAGLQAKIAAAKAALA